MPSIIKSFRVIETDIPKTTEKSDDNIKIKEMYIQEAILECEKIINKAEVESQRIIEDSKEQHESMINIAYDRAKEITDESRENGYNEGYKIGYNEGYGKGYGEGHEKGYDEGKAVSDKLIQDSLTIKEGYINEKNNLLKDLEQDIIDLVVNIYEKVIDKKTEEDSEIIISLVLNGIRNLDLTEKLTIITSKEDYGILEMSKDIILAKASMISDLNIKYDISLEKGDCILETSKGNIDVSVKNQLEEVKELLTTILNNE